MQCRGLRYLDKSFIFIQLSRSKVSVVFPSRIRSAIRSINSFKVHLLGLITRPVILALNGRICTLDSRELIPFTFPFRTSRSSAAKQLRARDWSDVIGRM